MTEDERLETYLADAEMEVMYCLFDQVVKAFHPDLSESERGTFYDQLEIALFDEIDAAIVPLIERAFAVLVKKEEKGEKP